MRAAPPEQEIRSRQSPDVSVEEMMADFVIWLADQPVPPGLRRRYHSSLTRFLSWQSAGPDAYADRTEWRYYAQLRRAGVSDAELAVVREAIAMLRRHLLTMKRAAWTRPAL